MRAAATRQMAIEANGRLREKLLAVLGLDDDGKTPLEEYVDQLAADRDRLAGEPAALQAGEQRHILDLREDGWTIQHPIACRPNLSRLPRQPGGEPGVAEPPAFGQFPVELNELGDRLSIGGRIPD